MSVEVGWDAARITGREMKVKWSRGKDETEAPMVRRGARIAERWSVKLDEAQGA
jgi:hypothetical protein